MKTPIPHLALSILSSLSLFGADGDILWEYQTGGLIYSSPAIADDGTIIFAQQNGDADNPAGTLYALHPNGNIRWMFDEAQDWMDADPVIAPDGTIYVGAWDNFLYAINGSDGSQKWSYETAGYILGSPVLDEEGSIYFGSSDGILYGLNANGQPLWSETVLTASSIESTPAIANGVIYVGDTLGYFYAFDAQTGNQNWVFDLTSVHSDSDNRGTGILTSPAIGSDGRIVFGSQNHRLYALDLSGNLLWSFEATDAIDSSPVLDDSDSAYFAARDGYLYAVDAQGFQKWETLIGDVFFASPTLDADGNLHLGAYEGDDVSKFVSVDSDGNLLRSLLFEGLHDSSATISADGSLYFGAYNGSLYKIEGSAPLSDTVWPKKHRNRRNTGSFSDAPNEETFFSLLPIIDENMDGMVYIDGWGSGWVDPTEFPYMSHQDHGTVFVEQVEGKDLLYYDFNLGWLHIDLNTPDTYFQSESNHWLRHFPEIQETTGQSWYWDFNSSSWVVD